MIPSERTLGLIGSAGGVEQIRPALIEPAIAQDWRVAVTLTPAAGAWLRELGEVERIEQVTGLPKELDYNVVYDELNDPNNHKVIVGDEVYVPISYNYRWVYVKESDLKSV
ncbi:hypothetical protein AB0H34_04070 [Saccharopolyspora shandongensis]|uniref:hypothetical protein n=1 Tax=Saccharopolyspora shandongensis TaxID=418495 RepID=UPI0033F7AABF